MSDKIEDLIESVKQQRDELRVQMHLGKAEAKEEWERLEKKFEQLTAEAKAQSKPLKKTVGETAEGVSSALELAADELKKGYARLRDLLK